MKEAIEILAVIGAGAVFMIVIVIIGTCCSWVKEKYDSVHGYFDAVSAKKLVELAETRERQYRDRCHALSLENTKLIDELKERGYRL